jgi:hypothetical protein
VPHSAISTRRADAPTSDIGGASARVANWALLSKKATKTKAEAAK